MKTSTLAGLGIAVVFTAGIARADDWRPEAGFVPMFNGKDFSGWQFGGGYALPEKLPANWKVTDGVIRLSGGGRPHLGSQWDYADFDMRFQWRALRPRYNSGFYIRSRRKVGNNQINLAKGAEGRFFGGKMKGGKPVPELQRPAGEWNEWRVRLEGGNVKFWCNGKLAWQGTEFQSKRGHIGLQAEGAPLEFRRLRIRELGVESLNEAKKWQQRGDANPWTSSAYGRIFSPQGLARLKADADYDNYTLRLEWRSEKSKAGRIGVIRDGRMTQVRIGDPEGIVVAGVKPVAGTDNPPGQWNYLQLTLAEGKLSVWQNGKQLVKEVDTAKGQAVDGGLIFIRAAEGGIEFRNMRIKPDSK